MKKWTRNPEDGVMTPISGEGEEDKVRKEVILVFTFQECIGVNGLKRRNQAFQADREHRHSEPMRERCICGVLNGMYKQGENARSGKGGMGKGVTVSKTNSSHKCSMHTFLLPCRF